MHIHIECCVEMAFHSIPTNYRLELFLVAVVCVNMNLIHKGFTSIPRITLNLNICTVRHSSYWILTFYTLCVCWLQLSFTQRRFICIHEWNVQFHIFLYYYYYWWSEKNMYFSMLGVHYDSLILHSYFFICYNHILYQYSWNFVFFPVLLRIKTEIQFNNHAVFRFLFK